MSLKPILMKTYNYSHPPYQSSCQIGKRKHSHVSISFLSCSSTYCSLHSYPLTLPCTGIAEELHFFMAFTICILLLKFSKRQFAASRKASFKISLSSNGSLCLPMTWKTRQEKMVAALPWVLGFGEDWLPCCQGRSEVRWRPGQEASLDSLRKISVTLVFCKLVTFRSLHDFAVHQPAVKLWFYTEQQS